MFTLFSLRRQAENKKITNMMIEINAGNILLLTDRCVSPAPPSLLSLSLSHHRVSYKF